MPTTTNKEIDHVQVSPFWFKKPEKRLFSWKQSKTDSQMRFLSLPQNISRDDLTLAKSFLTANVETRGVELKLVGGDVHSTSVISNRVKGDKVIFRVLAKEVDGVNAIPSDMTISTALFLYGILNADFRGAPFYLSCNVRDDDGTTAFSRWGIQATAVQEGLTAISNLLNETAGFLTPTNLEVFSKFVKIFVSPATYKGADCHAPDLILCHVMDHAEHRENMLSLLTPANDVVVIKANTAVPNILKTSDDIRAFLAARNANKDLMDLLETLTDSEDFALQNFIEYKSKLGDMFVKGAFDKDLLNYELDLFTKVWGREIHDHYYVQALDAAVDYALKKFYLALERGTLFEEKNRSILILVSITKGMEWIAACNKEIDVKMDVAKLEAELTSIESGWLDKKLGFTLDTMIDEMVQEIVAYYEPLTRGFLKSHLTWHLMNYQGHESVLGVSLWDRFTPEMEIMSIDRIRALQGEKTSSLRYQDTSTAYEPQRNAFFARTRKFYVYREALEFEEVRKRYDEVHKKSVDGKSEEKHGVVMMLDDRSGLSAHPELGTPFDLIRYVTINESLRIFYEVDSGLGGFRLFPRCQRWFITPGATAFVSRTLNRRNLSGTAYVQSSLVDVSVGTGNILDVLFSTGVNLSKDITNVSKLTEAYDAMLNELGCPSLDEFKSALEERDGGLEPIMVQSSRDGSYNGLLISQPKKVLFDHGALRPRRFITQETSMVSVTPLDDYENAFRRYGLKPYLRFKGSDFTLNFCCKVRKDSVSAMTRELLTESKTRTTEYQGAGYTISLKDCRDGYADCSVTIKDPFGIITINEQTPMVDAQDGRDVFRVNLRYRNVGLNIDPLTTLTMFLKNGKALNPRDVFTCFRNVLYSADVAKKGYSSLLLGSALTAAYYRVPFLAGLSEASLPELKETYVKRLNESISLLIFAEQVYNKMLASGAYHPTHFAFVSRMTDGEEQRAAEQEVFLAVRAMEKKVTTDNYKECAQSLVASIEKLNSMLIGATLSRPNDDRQSFIYATVTVDDLKTLWAFLEEGTLVPSVLYSLEDIVDVDVRDVFSPIVGDEIARSFAYAVKAHVLSKIYEKI